VGVVSGGNGETYPHSHSKWRCLLVGHLLFKKSLTFFTIISIMEFVDMIKDYGFALMGFIDETDESSPLHGQMFHAHSPLRVSPAEGLGTPQDNP